MTITQLDESFLKMISSLFCCCLDHFTFDHKVLQMLSPGGKSQKENPNVVKSSPCVLLQLLAMQSDFFLLALL